MKSEGGVSERVISYVLIGGLALSVAVELIGIATYYQQSGNFAFDYAPEWRVTGPNFFVYFLNLLLSLASVRAPFAVMALGIVLLMLTSYVRVLATLLYFTLTRNPKYVAISAFLTAILTLTLLEH